MKVLLFMEATLGGTARHLLDLATGLLGRDHEVHLVTSSLRASDAFLTGVEALRQKHPSLRHHIIPIQREVCASDLPAGYHLWRYIRAHGPFDIWHAHSTKAGFLLRLMVPRSGAAVVYTPHALMLMDPNLTGWKQHAVALLEATLARVSDAVVAVSQSEVNCAVRCGIPPSKITTIHNGLSRAEWPISTGRDAIRAGLGIPPEAVCVGWVGRLVANKEPSRLLEAMAVLRRKTSRKVNAIMIGWGPLNASLQAQAESLGLGGSVHFLGQVPAADYFPAFDIFAHTSRYEGFAYVFLEALVAGLPIVTTRVGAAEEILTDPAIGSIIGPWDPWAFVLELRRFVDDPALRAAAAPLARARATQFDGATMVDNTIELYRRVAKSPAADLLAAAPRAVLEHTSKMDTQ